ncbi:MAG: hypothetical protein HY869_12270 [Chloroflexi bacterium]|nr:hypothetical protein [Chloroflexota bacterium]
MNISAILLIPFGILVVALWYWIKIILRGHPEYRTDMLRQHTRDIANFHDLITWEKNPQKKTQYMALLVAFYATLLAALGDFLIYFVNIYNK